MKGRPRAILLSLFSHRLLAVARWDLRLLGLRLKNRLRGEDARLARLVAGRPRPRYLNLGAGPRGLDDPRWINVDACAAPGVHALLDFTRALPFPDGSFDGIFSEHVLEHFTDGEAAGLLREARRVLRPGGVIRLVVPDGERILRLYVDEPERLLAMRSDADAPTPMAAVNSYFRQRYEHQFIYDAPTLERALLTAGFVATARARCGVAQLEPALVLDDPRYEAESLYVEARA